MCARATVRNKAVSYTQPPITPLSSTFYGICLICVQCETRVKKNYLLSCLISAAASASIPAAYSPPFGKKRHGRLHPEAQTAYFKGFPIFYSSQPFPIFIFSLDIWYFSTYYPSLLNCREWRMDIPFKDVVFDTSDPPGSALSLLPLLFPDRKIDDMRISALTQGTTNGVSIPWYCPTQIHGTQVR